MFNMPGQFHRGLIRRRICAAPALCTRTVAYTIRGGEPFPIGYNKVTVSGFVARISSDADFAAEADEFQAARTQAGRPSSSNAIERFDRDFDFAIVEQALSRRQGLAVPLVTP
jgi:hypothetical protein